MRSMLSDEEKQYLIWLTAERYEGWGAVIDLGPWFGSSSAALAEGLRRTGKTGKVQSFDLFEWEWEPSYMEAVAHEQLKGGADFLPTFMQEIGDYAPWIEAHKQDLLSYTWEGGPIEILFVDAAKSWELTNAIFKGFGKHLVPGRSRVVLQDFRYHETHWLPLIFDSRPDLWKEIESVAFGTTVTFMPLKALDGPAGIHYDYSEAAFRLEAAELLLRSRIAREAPQNRSLFLRALYRKAVIEGSPDTAHAGTLQALREELRVAGITKEELESLESWTILVPLGWEAYTRHDYEGAKRFAERCLSGSQRPVYAVALLGMALLRLGELPGAKSCIEAVASRMPDYLPSKLYRAELALAERRYADARADVLEALKAFHDDEPHIEYGLGLLEQTLHGADRGHQALTMLTSLRACLGGSPAFLTSLARAQHESGKRSLALQSVAEALEKAPGHQGAMQLREEWANG
jgi:tetratricopeptide (TPR) repeat protein